MQQPSLFPDHQDTQPEPMLTERQMVALIEVMSQIVKAFFEREGGRYLCWFTTKLPQII